MSAQLNTVSGTIYEDFVVKMTTARISESKASIIMKCTVVIIGCMCVCLVFMIKKLKGIVQMAISLGGVTSGAIMSVFTLGICFPRANSRGAMCGMLASLGIMTWIVAAAQIAIVNNELKFVQKDVSIVGCPFNTTFKQPTDFSGMYRLNEDVYVSPDVWKIYAISYMHYNTLGSLIGIVIGLVVSYLFPTDQKVNPNLLAPCIRKFVYPVCTEQEKSNQRRSMTDDNPVFQDSKL